MNQQTTLTEDNLRLTAVYLNMDDEGKVLLDTVIKKLTESTNESEQVTTEKVKEEKRL